MAADLSQIGKAPRLTIEFPGGMPAVKVEGAVTVKEFALAAFILNHMGEMMAIQGEAMKAAEAAAIAAALGGKRPI